MFSDEVPDGTSTLTTILKLAPKGQEGNMNPLLHAVLDDPANIDGAEHFDSALKTVLSFCKARSWKEAPTVIVHSRFSDRLLYVLLMSGSTQQSQDLFIGLMTTDPNCWMDETLRIDTAAKALERDNRNPGGLFNYLLKHHADFLAGDHPLVEAISPDEGWRAQVNYHLAKRDWIRAWESIKKAVHGICVGKDIHDQDITRFKISTLVLSELINKLFERMLAAGIVKEQPGELEVAQEHSEPVYELKKPKTDALGRNRQRRAYNQTHKRSGWHVAVLFGQKVQYHTWSINQTGLRALAIAAYVSGKRSQKRQRRFATLAKC